MSSKLVRVCCLQVSCGSFACEEYLNVDISNFFFFQQKTCLEFPVLTQMEAIHIHCKRRAKTKKNSGLMPFEASYLARTILRRTFDVTGHLSSTGSLLGEPPTDQLYGVWFSPTGPGTNVSPFKQFLIPR